MAPSAAPAPTTVCSSSMKSTTSRERWISSSTPLSRSSNSPRYLAPATMPPRSSASTRLPRRISGTSTSTIFWARPSTMAVLPTPGSPMRTGLFLVRRDEHLDDALDLLVAADHRVELAVARLGGQVGRVLLEHALASGAGLEVLAHRADLPEGAPQRSPRSRRRRAARRCPGLRPRGRCRAAGARSPPPRRPASAPPGRRCRGPLWRAASCRASPRDPRARSCRPAGSGPACRRAS